MARLLMTRICVCVCVYVCEKEGCHVACPPPLVHYVERRAGGWAGLAIWGAWAKQNST